MPNYHHLHNDPENQINSLGDDVATPTTKLELRLVAEEVELQGIPSVYKPGYGNWMWAEEQCARRCGLTTEEATAVQEAFRVYQDEGDPATFYKYARDTVQGMTLGFDLGLGTDPSPMARRILKGLAHRMEIAEVMVPMRLRAGLSIYRIALETAYHRQFIDDRVRVLVILKDLIAVINESLVAADVPANQGTPESRGNATSSTPVSQITQQTACDGQLKYSKASESPINRESEAPITNPEPDKGEVKQQDPFPPPRTAKHRNIPGGGPAEQHPRSEVMQAPLKFDRSKLDHAKFDALVQRLLKTRYHELDGQAQTIGPPLYVIIGWFSKGSSDPYEKLLTLKDDEALFKQLRKGVRSVRGWREYLSLKSLQRFGLYKCDIPRGAHIKLELSLRQKATLSHFFLAHKASGWHPDKDVAEAWTQWVHRNLNAESDEPVKGKYSLQLIYGWSPIRLSILVAFPVLFSFAVGLSYMIRTGDVSTAWTISSYIVTAAGAIIALLAILGSLKSG